MAAADERPGGAARTSCGRAGPADGTVYDVENHAERLADDVALWSVSDVTIAQVVEHACEALVGGLDSQALRELGGASPTTSALDIEGLLRQTAEDFGFAFYPQHSEERRLAAARVLARRCLTGEISPREFARWLHSRIGHGHENEQLEALVSLDDSYDIVESASRHTQEIDREVMDGARLLLRFR